MKRMRHPIHGWHHPLNAAEEAQMRGNGWVDDVPAVKADKPQPERVKRRGRVQ